jgi:hypothetical protein
MASKFDLGFRAVARKTQNADIPEDIGTVVRAPTGSAGAFVSRFQAVFGGEHLCPTKRQN